jgi:creatinine amidohydrolase/Fe(II)-dependent formamide hydrolase-like protein
MGLKNSRHVPRIKIHPKDPDIVFAAVLGDLYKSSAERGVYNLLMVEHHGKKYYLLMRMQELLI